MLRRIAHHLAVAALLLSIAGGTFAIATANATTHGGSAPLAAEAATSDKFAQG